MNIQPGDWVVLTGKKWDNGSYPRYSIQKAVTVKKKSDIDWVSFEEGVAFEIVDGWEVQRIQYYFGPGDGIEIICEDNYKLENRFIHHIENDKIYVSDHLYIKLPLGCNKVAIKSIRNLTKEGKMKETNKEKPVVLTAKDLLEKDACDPGFQKFVARFGKSVNLKDNALKEWFEQNPYKSWLENNLPDHYAVIFDSWQPKINEIIWYKNRLQIIGRVYEIVNERVDVLWQSDDRLKTFDICEIRPISKRPFQVGDTVYDNVNHNYIKIADEENANKANQNKTRFELDISPAIPEVK